LPVVYSTIRYFQLLKWLPTFSVFYGLPLPWPTWEDVVSRYHLVYQHETFSVFYSTTSSSFEASPFVILRFWVAWSFLLHNRTPYFVDHMSLILIFLINITTVGRVLEVCYFTTTTITTDSSLPFAQSCRLTAAEMAHLRSVKGCTRLGCFPKWRTTRHSRNCKYWWLQETLRTFPKTGLMTYSEDRLRI